MSLYLCSQCRLPPLRWRAGSGYCYKHAVALSLLPVDPEYDKPDAATLALQTVLRKPKRKLTLAEKMAALTAELRAEGNWEEYQENYQPDLFGTSKAGERLIPELDMPYTDSHGEPSPLPF